jgi:hypothetical protein
MPQSVPPVVIAISDKVPPCETQVLLLSVNTAEPLMAATCVAEAHDTLVAVIPGTFVHIWAFTNLLDSVETNKIASRNTFFITLIVWFDLL